MSGSSQVKAKRKEEPACRGTVPKASFRSRMVTWEVVAGMLERELCGLLTTGWIGITASLMGWRS